MYGDTKTEFIIFFEGLHKYGNRTINTNKVDGNTYLIKIFVECGGFTYTKIFPGGKTGTDSRE